MANRSSDADPVRIDKWLMVARVFKTRSAAARACALGRVKINGNKARPHKKLKVGDALEVELGDWKRELTVLVLAAKPVRKDLAPSLYQDTGEPRPKRDPVERALRSKPFQRERGSGRPSKRERRLTDRLRGR